jgi:hypothetical protein
VLVQQYCSIVISHSFAANTFTHISVVHKTRDGLYQLLLYIPHAAAHLTFTFAGSKMTDAIVGLFAVVETSE